MSFFFDKGHLSETLSSKSAALIKMENLKLPQSEN